MSHSSIFTSDPSFWGFSSVCEGMAYDSILCAWIPTVFSELSSAPGGMFYTMGVGRHKKPGNVSMKGQLSTHGPSLQFLSQRLVDTVRSSSLMHYTQGNLFL